MGGCASLFSLVLLFAFAGPQLVYGNVELRALMEMKASLDPENRFLSSWNSNGDPCSGSFEGIACNEHGKVANISLQGKGLSGRVPPAVAGLQRLSGLYLHYNSLSGEIPREISNLTELYDLYLNDNNLSGNIPPEIGDMASLQVLQLCSNHLTGEIPTQLGSLKKLSVLALQSNRISGAIPANLGELQTLTRLDVSFNQLFGSIPAKLADVPQLKVLDVRNNTLSGNVPPALKKLNDGFQYGNNSGLCGVAFPSLRTCTATDQQNPDRLEPLGAVTNGTSTKFPETANFQVHCNQTNCSNPSKPPRVAVVIGVIAITVALMVTGLLTFSCYRRRKQKIGSAFDTSDSRLSTDQAKEVYRKSASPLISLEYSNGWDPLADGRNVNGFSQDVLQSFRFNLEEVESATQHFSEVNLLGKSNFSAIYKGILRDGSVVAIKSINKSSCKTEEGDFLKGLNILTLLRHENLVGLRGFCCSRDRGECFLIYEFVPNGNLLQYLDQKEGNGRFLEWSNRVSIIHGIAKGIEYLHSNKPTKPALVHQNISADKVLIDQGFKPLLSDSGLHKLLADDIVFSVLKASAAMGYLAPEYTTTGRFTEKSDVYAFGVIVLQILSGRRMISQSMRVGAETCRFEEFMDKNLDGKFLEAEAEKMTRIALDCTHESPNHRPNMETVIQELSK
ncbi:LRR receptor-like serine/threonine-protein kinase GSO2 [Telopea speciosissima]|uniref:LRR receptor-like serine/threonine-protein kinase GSO2 n=1 Tax=Telopea speciosissima TaxID=54955 RepID=UPI001CC57BAA|nr:LRR receptor-like serine/threonine-protein kinase GSO2 [Telopea speciosissima]XP_043694916.1 LRR receptor-like serine/threonine-protein kinase GSO2 [Telopea speciosissima]